MTDIEVLSDIASTVRIRITGDVADPLEAEQLYRAICTAVLGGAALVEVDLAGLDLLAPVGIGALIRAQREAEHQCCRVRLVDASRFVRRLLTIAGVTDILGLGRASG